MLVNPDAPYKREVRTRQRASTSCIECRRRKQKCNQAKDRPCNNCARRYPPVPCTYEVFVRKPSNYRESVVELGVARLKAEESDIEQREVLPIHRRSTTSQLAVSQVLPTQPGAASQPSSPSSGLGWISPKLQDLLEEDCVATTGQDGNLSEEEVRRDLSPLFRVRKCHNYPKHFQRAFYGMTRRNVGDTIDPFKCLPVDQSRRNTEFIQFFVKELAPYMSSIDGHDPPLDFHRPWVDFMVKSPIIGHITILSSSYFYAMCQNIDIDKSVEVMTARAKLIHIINNYIAGNKQGVKDEVIATVMSLAYNELIYADEKSTAAHMRGLADMVQTRGGLEYIEFAHLRKLITRTDFHVALTFECDLFLQDDERTKPISVLDTYPLELDNPCLLSRIKFVHSMKALGISYETAALLDDMRLLTTAVIHLGRGGARKEEETQLHTTIETISSRLTASNSSGNLEHTKDYIYQTCRTAATIYCTAIRTRTRFSKACTSGLLQQMWSTMWRISLQTWKKIPGIFLWLLLIVNPYAKDKPESRFLKGLMPATTMAIGLVDWEVVTNTLHACLAVQRYVGQNRGDGVLSSVIPRSLPPENGIPAWALTCAG